MTDTGMVEREIEEMADRNMVERIARTLFIMFRSVRCAPGPAATAWRDYEADARLILRTMHNPTEAMVLAGFLDDREATSAEIWPAMIDAALEEGR